MSDDPAARIQQLQQEIAELEADSASATGNFARLIAQRLPQARAELDALVGAGMPAESSPAGQRHASSPSRPAPLVPAAALEISGSDAAHIHDNTQIVSDVVNYFYGGQAPEQEAELLADYLAGLVRSCQELHLERIQRAAKDGNEQSKAPPLTLNEVFAQLTTDGPPITVHERAGTIEQLTRLWVRIMRPELAIDAIRSYRQVVLLGEPGGGKSTLLRWLAAQLALAAQGRIASPLLPTDATPPIPILLPLGQLDRQLADSLADPAEVLLGALEAELDGHKTTPGLSAYLRPALRRGGVILLLDGLDELPVTASGRHPVHL